MKSIKHFLCCCYRWLNATRQLDFIAPLALRIYLVPTFWIAGMNKWTHLSGTIAWFDKGLGLPFPWVMAHLAMSAEIGGAVCLALGLAVRWATIPLMITMLVAIFTVHWHNGWSAINESSQAMRSVAHMVTVLKSNAPQHHEVLTELGRPVILNNGIEFGVTYFVMLLVLFFQGAGNYFSLDYWLMRLSCHRKTDDV